MRFIVLGAGAVGSLVGGQLAGAGQDVVLVGRPEHATRINAGGLQIKSPDGVRQVRLPAVDAAKTLDPTPNDVVLLAVKTQQTADAVRTLPQEIPVFCLQNGVRGEAIAAQRLMRVYGVMVALGARFTAPGEIVHFSGNLLAIGRYPRGTDRLAQAVAEALVSAGLQVHLSEDVMAVKWEKLLVNLTNAVYAITDTSIIEVRNSSDGRLLLAAAWEEGLRVLQRAGIHHAPIPGRPAIEEEIERLRRPDDVHSLPEDPDLFYYPSTWQDLFLRRGQTEVAYFNGEIAQLGREAGIPTPINDLLLDTVDDMAARKEPPGRWSLTELRARAGL